MAGIEDNKVEEDVIETKLKYNDYWRIVPKTGREKYDLENQMTLRVECDNTSLKIFGKQVANFLPVARGHLLKLLYTIPNTKPWQFEGIRSNEKFMEVLRTHLERGKIDMFLVL